MYSMRWLIISGLVVPKVVEDALAVIGKQVIERSKHLFVGRLAAINEQVLVEVDACQAQQRSLPGLPSSRSKPTFSPDIIRW